MSSIAVESDRPPSQNNILNSDSHEELLIEIFTFLTLNFAQELAVLSKRFKRVADDDSWKPNLLLYAWGSETTSGRSREVVRPELLQLFYSPQKRRQVRQITCTNCASFALTYGGNLYWWGEMQADGESLCSPQPSILEPLRDHDIVRFDATVPGYYHTTTLPLLQNSKIHVAVAFTDRDGDFFEWGMNLTGHMFVPMTVDEDFTISGVQRELLREFREEQLPLLAERHSMLTDEFIQMQFEQFIAAHPMARRAERMNYVAEPTKPEAFTERKETVTLFSCGVTISAAVAVDPSGISRVYQAADNKLTEILELRNIPIKQLVCGGWFCLALDSTGDVWSWGDRLGPDTSNGSLLGRYVGGRSTLHAARIEFPDEEKVKFITASTYNALAISESGTAYTWGDSDGYGLGHSTKECHEPTQIDAHLTAVDASLCYTSGSISSVEGSIYIWGGKVWAAVAGLVGGIKESVSSQTGFTEVSWAGTALGYHNKQMKLGHRHGIIIAEKNQTKK